MHFKRAKWEKKQKMKGEQMPAFIPGSLMGFSLHIGCSKQSAEWTSGSTEGVSSNKIKKYIYIESRPTTAVPIWNATISSSQTTNEEITAGGKQVSPCRQKAVNA